MSVVKSDIAQAWEKKDGDGSGMLAKLISIGKLDECLTAVYGILASWLEQAAPTMQGSDRTQLLEMYTWHLKQAQVISYDEEGWLTKCMTMSELDEIRLGYVAYCRINSRFWTPPS